MKRIVGLEGYPLISQIREGDTPRKAARGRKGYAMPQLSVVASIVVGKQR